MGVDSKQPSSPLVATTTEDQSRSAQQIHDDILDIVDVIGKRIISTRLRQNVTIREENGIAALEVISRFAVNPKWLIYLPPTIHLTFAGPGFVICSFVPRVVDYHENAIPCPYGHASVHCDEIILYDAGNFTSRRGIESGSISVHPAGVPHGPHPGAYQASVGIHRTNELAVMCDTFKPLKLTTVAQEIEDGEYHTAWVRKTNSASDPGARWDRV